MYAVENFGRTTFSPRSSHGNWQSRRNRYFFIVFADPKPICFTKMIPSKNHKKKLSLRHCLPNFGSFSSFQASLSLGVDKVLQKLTKSCKSQLRYLFQCCIMIPRICPSKTQFQHTVPPILTDQLTLFQLEGTDYAQLITTLHPPPSIWIFRPSTGSEM